MKRIISLAIVLSLGMQLFAMQREEAADERTQKKAQQKTEIVTAAPKYLTKEALLGSYILKYNESNPPLNPKDCDVVAGCFEELSNPVASPDRNDTKTRSLRATLNLINTLKHWMSLHLNIQAFESSDLTVKDIHRLMGNKSSRRLSFQEPDCIEMLLRFICVYYPEKSVDILTHIGFQFFYVSESRYEPDEEYINKTLAGGSKLEFLRKYFSVHAATSNVAMLKNLYSLFRYSADALFFELFKPNEIYTSFPLLFMQGTENCLTIHGLKNRNVGKGEGRPMFIARPGPDVCLQWAPDYSYFYNGKRPAIVIAPFLRPEIAKEEVPFLAYADLKVMGEELRKQMAEPQPHADSFELVKDNVVCSMQ